LHLRVTSPEVEQTLRNIQKTKVDLFYFGVVFCDKAVVTILKQPKVILSATGKPITHNLTLRHQLAAGLLSRARSRHYLPDVRAWFVRVYQACSALQQASLSEAHASHGVHKIARPRDCRATDSVCK
jgi:hypothetical protein